MHERATALCLATAMAFAMLPACGGDAAREESASVDDEATSTYVAKTRLGRQGERFAINGQPTFLLGVSYFSCLYASQTRIVNDLDYFRSRGIDVIRCWVNWPIQWKNWLTESSLNTVLIRADGTLDAAALDQLKFVIEEADARGIVVDVTFNQDTPHKTFAAHRDGIRRAAVKLLPYRNVLFDLQNETDHYPEQYFMDPAEVEEVANLVTLKDPARVQTASVRSSASASELYAYAVGTGLHVAAYHCCRGTGWEDATKQAVYDVRDVLACPATPSRPIYFQEPNRCRCLKGGLVCSLANGVDCNVRSNGSEFVDAAKNAKRAGAAAWVFHTMAGYDLRNGFRGKLNLAELDALDALAGATAAVPWGGGCN